MVFWWGLVKIHAAVINTRLPSHLVMEHLGGTAPAINEPTGWTTRTKRMKWKRSTPRVLGGAP